MTAAAAPLSHAAALDLAAGEPVFPLAGAEARDLRDHLRSCPDCARRAARMRVDLAAIGRIDPAMSPRLHDRIREIAVTQPRAAPSPFGILVVLALLAVGVVGVSAGIVAMAGPRLLAPTVQAPVLPADPDDQVDWRTDVVALAAHELLIGADGRTFHGIARPVLTSDPGDPTRWTLEATWQEQGREQRLFLTFGSDGTDWWVDEVRVYDGSASPKWATFPAAPAGGWLRTPLGQAFSGDLNLAGTSATGPVRLHLGGLRVAVVPQDNVAEPVGGVRKVLTEDGNPAVDGNPFGRGGSLACSGILELPPQAAEARLQLEGYALSWRWQTATSANTGTSEPMGRAPSSGWITDTAVGSNGELILFVANPANPPGGPLGARATLPAWCPAP